MIRQTVLLLSLLGGSSLFTMDSAARHMGEVTCEARQGNLDAVLRYFKSGFQSVPPNLKIQSYLHILVGATEGFQNNEKNSRAKASECLGVIKFLLGYGQNNNFDIDSANKAILEDAQKLIDNNWATFKDAELEKRIADAQSTLANEKKKDDSYISNTTKLGIVAFGIGSLLYFFFGGNQTDEKTEQEDGK